MTIVKEAVREWKESRREVFLPLSHRPGEAQVDYGFADVVLNGETVKVALFGMTLSYSDAIYMQAFPRECSESFLEGHKRAFEFFGGVPTRISYDNSKIAVGKITGTRERQVTTEFQFLTLRGSFSKSHDEQLKYDNPPTSKNSDGFSL